MFPEPSDGKVWSWVPWGSEPKIIILAKASIKLPVSQLIIIYIILSVVRLSPLGTVATIGLFYRPQMIDDDDCGAIGGMRIGRGNRSTRRKPAPAPLCPPQIPHIQTRARTRSAGVGSQRLTARTMARPSQSA
jgi:hypothetical protein